MVIVNQKKDIVINFLNVLSIYIQGKNVQVLISCIEDALIIGKYKTEKRAKEVLQEIVNKYRQYNLDNNKAVTMLPKIYEMPEE